MAADGSVLGVDVGGTKIAVGAVRGAAARNRVEHPTRLTSTTCTASSSFAECSTPVFSNTQASATFALENSVAGSASVVYLDDAYLGSSTTTARVWWTTASPTR